MKKRNVLKLILVFLITIVLLLLFFLISMILFQKLIKRHVKKSRKQKNKGTKYRFLEYNPYLNRSFSGIIESPSTQHSDLIDETYVSYRKEDGSYVCISTFESEEYVCNGRCICETNSNGKRALNSVNVLGKRFIYLLAAVTSYVAYESAKRYFENECSNQEEEEYNDCTTIRSEVDSCEGFTYQNDEVDQALKELLEEGELDGLDDDDEIDEEDPVLESIKVLDEIAAKYGEEEWDIYGHDSTADEELAKMTVQDNEVQQYKSFYCTGSCLTRTFDFLLNEEYNSEDDSFIEFLQNEANDYKCEQLELKSRIKIYVPREEVLALQDFYWRGKKGKQIDFVHLLYMHRDLTPFCEKTGIQKVKVPDPDIEKATYSMCTGKRDGNNPSIHCVEVDLDAK